MSKSIKLGRTVIADLLITLFVVAVLLVIGVSACPPTTWVPDTATSSIRATPFEPESGEPCELESNRCCAPSDAGRMVSVPP